jgi:hypothetical protein
VSEDKPEIIGTVVKGFEFTPSQLRDFKGWRVVVEPPVPVTLPKARRSALHELARRLETEAEDAKASAARAESTSREIARLLETPP